MKKFLLSLALVAFAATAMNAQTTAPQQDNQVKKECCKDMKDGKKCDKPADQQCPDCKAKAEGKKCAKAEGKKCEKIEGMKKCEKAEGMKKCEKAEGMKKCEKAEGMKKDCCKKEGEMKKCDKPADQQCPDCKANAAKKD